ncbi:MAG: hydrolase 1, exosortase A system-associated [Propionivibrio sp.]
MGICETVVVFGHAGEQLVGVMARPGENERASDVGVLVVVGGPQYRVGSHRQFLLLSRRIAAVGHPVFRFDYRGMGDSGGAPRGFDAVSSDIGAAVDAFLQACPSVNKVVLWGLCDAASAALIHIDACADHRVAGLILLNPWVRSETTLAQTHIKHYYGNRLMQKEFWLKLVAGKLQVTKAVRGLMKSMLLARGAAAQHPNGERPFQARMANGWKGFPGEVLLILSGQDYTAMEFLDYVASNADWSALMARKGVTRIDIADADHTFSSARFRASVENASIAWLERFNDRLA